MNDQSYLIFQLNQSRYGTPAMAVQEIFFLPEVTAIAGVPAPMLGVINLRGELLPILDLHQRLGQPRLPFQLTNSMIVLEWQTQRVGVIVSQVDEMQTIASEQVTADLVYGRSEEKLQDGIIIGIATVENNIITLLNPEPLVQQAVEQTILNSPNGLVNGAREHISKSGLDQRLYDHFDVQSQQVLRERTAALQGVIEDQDSAELLPLAVVGLGGEYFGFGLETVHEFTEIDKITPIPCCPPRIVGNINLRGEIVTLININDVVDLPVNVGRSHPQAVVVRLDQQVVGIAVDAIFDVAYIHPSQITTASIATHSDENDYFQGIAPYQDRMMSIINLPKLLTSDLLIVDEEV